MISNDMADHATSFLMGIRGNSFSIVHLWTNGTSSESARRKIDKEMGLAIEILHQDHPVAYETIAICPVVEGKTLVSNSLVGQEGIKDRRSLVPAWTDNRRYTYAFGRLEREFSAFLFLERLEQLANPNMYALRLSIVNGVTIGDPRVELERTRLHHLKEGETLVECRRFFLPKLQPGVLVDVMA